MLQQFNPKNKDLIVNINGDLLHRDKAGVSPFDSTVQNGDGVWEGLRLYNRRIFKLGEHLDRLYKSAGMLQYRGLPERPTLIDELKRTLAANDMTDGVHIRLTISRGVKYTSGLDPRINQKGCSFFILAEHKPPVYDKSGLKFITASVRRPPENVLDQKIHSCNQLTSILAKLEANAADVDDALLLDTRGFLAETNATHVFIVKDDCVQTSTCVACPEGITRSTVMALCERHGIAHTERDITPDELFAADEMFCTGTMGELAAVIELDGRTIGGGKLGPMTERLSGLYTQLTASSGEVVVE